MSDPIPAVLHLIPVLTRGGAELQLTALAEAQSRRGMDVTVACLTSSQELRGRLEVSGVTVLVARRGIAGFVRDVVRAARRAAIVHSWMYHAFVMSTFLRPWGTASHIWAIRRTHPDSDGLRGRTRVIARLCSRLSGRLADGLVYCSAAARTAHEEFGFDAPLSAVVFNAVAIPPAGPPSDREGTPVTFGVLARWDRDKGIDVLMDAWCAARAELDGATLILAGPGLDGDNAELRAALDRRGLDGVAELRGAVDDPVSFLRSLDCLVSPSRTEGFPNVIAEAMALGTPVIATDVGGTSEVLGDCGLLVRGDEGPTLGSALRDFVRDPADLRRRAADGPARAEQRFSIDSTVQATEHFYEVVRGRRS
jgi:glycosyltransferase involved in cell wall biosynthesis